jgi:hypothetical protein
MKNTLIDALNAELLSDVQKMHIEVTELKKEISGMTANYELISKSAESVKNNLDETAVKFETMARGILGFAKDERLKNDVIQKHSLEVLTASFMKQLEVNTNSFNVKLWVLISLLGLNFGLIAGLFAIVLSK